MPETEIEYEISLKKLDKFKFLVDFGKETIPELLMDESQEVPGGEEKGPTASMLLAAAVGNCLSASLTFCLMKKRVKMYDLRTKVKFKRARDEEGFWRIKEITVELSPTVDNVEDNNFKRCVDIFFNYCIVSASVKKGIPINIRVTPIAKV